MSEDVFKDCEKCLCNSCENSYRSCGYSHCSSCIEDMKKGLKGFPMTGKCAYMAYNPINKWINPKDRLPDDDNVVLVIIGFSVVFEKRQRYATITAFYCHKLEQWITSPTEFGFHYPLVIAWQPIEPFKGWD